MRHHVKARKPGDARRANEPLPKNYFECTDCLRTQRGERTSKAGICKHQLRIP